MKRAKKSWRNGVEPGTPEWDSLHNTPQDCERMRGALISIQVAITEGASTADINAIVYNGLFGRSDPYNTMTPAHEGEPNAMLSRKTEEPRNG